jgi:hypothetical protein
MKDHQLGYVLPALPLGPAIPQVLPISEAHKTANARFMFEDFEWPTAEGVEIAEQDCKQIKGTAPQGTASVASPHQEGSGLRSEGLKPNAPVVAAPPFKVGDRVRVIACRNYQPADLLGQVLRVDDLDGDEGKWVCLEAAGWTWSFEHNELEHV